VTFFNIISLHVSIELSLDLSSLAARAVVGPTIQPVTSKLLTVYISVRRFACVLKRGTVSPEGAFSFNSPSLLDILSSCMLQLQIL
jgi:hypothetical protein